MTPVITKFGVFLSPNINRLAAMNQGNPLGPLVQAGGRPSFFPHVQTSIGGGGQIRALPVQGNVYPSTNHLF